MPVDPQGIDIIQHIGPIITVGQCLDIDVNDSWLSYLDFRDFDAYKKDVDDTRESPALKIAEKLLKKGYGFEYSDPYVSKILFINKVKKSKKINASLLKKHKIVLIVTDHSKFNYKLISQKAQYIFDSRNVIKNRTKNYFKT